MDVQEVLDLVQFNLDCAQFCSDRDWEFNTNCCGYNASEAAGVLKGLAKEINAKAGEEIIKLEYDVEKMKDIYRGYGYPVDEEDEEY